MQAALIAALALLCYAGTMCSPFVFDDTLNIVENPFIRTLGTFSDTSEAAASYPMFRSRILGYLSFALNYQAGELHPQGYHAVNLGIHICSALLVYALFILLLKSAAAPDEGGSELGTYGPFLAALLFAVHPLQTQAITYISQRFASMSAMFVLLSIVCYLASRMSRSGLRHALYALALLACLLGMKTKETAIMGPVVLALAEWMFLSGTLRRRALYVAPFAAMMLIVPLTLLAEKPSTGLLDRAQTVASMTEPVIGRMDYAVTQIAVVTTYLRLLVLPVGQNLDYDYPVYHSLLEPRIITGALVLMALAGLGAWLYRRRAGDAASRISAFGILWFFITLSLESSFLPLKDIIFEHRAYLPSAGLFIAAAALWYRSRFAHTRAGAAMAILAVVILFEATVLRNEVWRTELALWQDVTAKSPNKSRPFTNLGNAYAEEGNRREAIRAYERAIELNAGQIEPYANLALAYAEEGDFGKSVKIYEEAMRINPTHVITMNGYASTLLKLGQTEQAIAVLSQAVKLDGSSARSYYNLGLALSTKEDYGGAIEAYTQALRISPDSAPVNTNLGAAYLAVNRNEQALTHFRRASELSPDNPDEFYNLAVVYLRLGLIAQARQAIDRALKLNPNHKLALELFGDSGKRP